MGDLILVFPDNSEHLVVKSGKVTKEDGVIFELNRGESLMVKVNEHDDIPKIAFIRVEFNRKVKSQSQLFYGQLGEKENIPFECIGGTVRVVHRETELS